MNIYNGFSGKGVLLSKQSIYLLPILEHINDIIHISLMMRKFQIVEF